MARAIYAFSWYDIGAVPTLIESGLHIGVAQFGIILGSFLIGAAVFQLPAGLAAMRWGSRRVSLVALAVMGAFALASGFAPNWYVLAALRFGVGAGAALFFSPALGMVAGYFPAGSRGPVIGLYNAGFSAGAAAGLLLGAVIGTTLGWPWALGLGGVALLLAAGATSVFLPDVLARPPRRTLSELLVSARPVLRSRALWFLALGLTGLWALYYIVAQFFVAYAGDVHPGWPLAVAVSLPTVMILVEIVGGPAGGLFGERTRDMRRPLLLAGVPSAAAVLLIPVLPIDALFVVFIFLGIAAGVSFAVLYLIPSYLPEVRGEGFSLALALINGIQILAGSALAIAFGFLAADLGYTVAWIFAAGVGLAPLVLLFGVPGNRPSGTGDSSVRPAQGSSVDS